MCRKLIHSASEMVPANYKRDEHGATSPKPPRKTVASFKCAIGRD